MNFEVMTKKPDIHYIFGLYIAQPRCNDAILMKESYFSCQCKASLKILEMEDSLMAYLHLDTKCQNEVAKLLRSLLPL